MLTDPHDGLPYDFDQVRVFTWNTRKHRYETAYREHGLDGILPVTITKEEFDKEGILPVFILRVKDDAGNVSERKYKLNTPIVQKSAGARRSGLETGQEEGSLVAAPAVNPSKYHSFRSFSIPISVLRFRASRLTY